MNKTDSKVLERVLEAEKEIQLAISNEKKKIDQWLGEIRKKSEDKLQRLKTESDEQFSRKTEKHRADIINSAEHRMQRANLFADRLRNIQDEEILPVIKRHLKALLPEEDAE